MMDIAHSQPRQTQPLLQLIGINAIGAARRPLGAFGDPAGGKD